MKIKFEKHITQEIEVDVDLPYFYLQTFGDEDYDVFIHGKITESACFQITKTEYIDGRIKFETDTENYKSINQCGDLCYIDDKYKSSESAYFKIKSELIKNITTL